ncbi:hypothetical protein MPER_04832 [Moniliophthora perniciosa FA553]|nr:hypothetical protein MPER_04832 [Moniliophthora perniciosa FA553]
MRAKHIVAKEPKETFDLVEALLAIADVNTKATIADLKKMVGAIAEKLSEIHEDEVIDRIADKVKCQIEVTLEELTKPFSDMTGNVSKMTESASQTIEGANETSTRLYKELNDELKGLRAEIKDIRNTITSPAGNSPPQPNTRNAMPTFADIVAGHGRTPQIEYSEDESTCGPQTDADPPESGRQAQSIVSKR